MATAAQLRRFRNELSEARYSGVREVQDQSGERLVYKSDSEMARAIAALDAEIAALTGSRSSTILFSTSKGL